MRVWDIWILLGVLCVSVSSRAESRLRPHELVQAATDASGLRRQVTSPSEWPVNFGTWGPAGARAAGTRIGLGYRTLLGALVITRDLPLPGTSFLAFRLIPTRRALGGEIEVPIVLRPRVIATSWYGVDALVRF
jgi:hypothetical protein